MQLGQLFVKISKGCNSSRITLNLINKQKCLTGDDPSSACLYCVEHFLRCQFTRKCFMKVRLAFKVDFDKIIKPLGQTIIHQPCFTHLTGTTNNQRFSTGRICPFQDFFLCYSLHNQISRRPFAACVSTRHSRKSIILYTIHSRISRVNCNQRSLFSIIRGNCKNVA